MTELNTLVQKCGEGANANGWHDRYRNCPSGSPEETDHVTAKTALIATEVAEAIECIRNGEMDEYVGEGGKPEGFPVELADAVIRIFDLAYMTGTHDLEDVIQRKLAHNARRGQMHGGKLL